ncbi:MAG: hypothetical protein MI742_09440 [Desulfobacterales bacterium]|nr:hypothetical protein [Desulfobacterales bacterium]
MISKTTASSLQLKPHTIKTCQDLYEEISQDSTRSIPVRQILLHHASDPQALNKMWWVLNYHAESLDRHRRHRAWVEARLDELARDHKRRYPLEA